VKSVLRSRDITQRALRKRLEKLEALVERFNRGDEAKPRAVGKSRGV